MSQSYSTSRPCRLRDVPGWDLETDVAVVGFGSSGASAGSVAGGRVGASTVWLRTPTGVAPGVQLVMSSRAAMMMKRFFFTEIGHLLGCRAAGMDYSVSLSS